MRETSSEAPGEAMFQVRGMTKKYGGRTILDGLNFDVNRGECLVILGRSGSGKSVTLRQLNGLETPEAGTVMFGGINLTELSEHQLFPYRRRIGMLFQSGALFDSMNVFDNIAFPLREHSGKSEGEIAETVRQKLEMVRLKDVEKKMPSDLSGGMRKRAALARSLALDPEAMLFDEPTTGLDPVTSATIGKLIRSIQSELGVTSVVVTHDIPLARHVGDRLAFLSAGRFTFIGDWEQAERDRETELADFLDGRDPEEVQEGAHVA
ncbi:MAG TPA: ATP-binding cassette domain-containing protein [Thermoanaerobaculia bacterium]|nr:ATP-binding cassette domain-containing protein [Thermoanaerobaculia bacterium]